MHWTRRVTLLALFLLPSAITASAYGQAPVVSSPTPTNSDPGVVYMENVSGSMAFGNDGGNYFLFDKMIGDGVGFAEGWQRLGFRGKLWDFGESHLFGEIHAMITDDSRVGFNVGGGYRWLTANGGLWGVNGWYDNFETNHGFRYDQFTFGGEYLHPIFDARTNVYIPTGTRENFVGIYDPGTIPVYLGNSVGTNGIGLIERAYYGWDAEGGVGVPGTDWLRAYVGPYVLGYDGDNVAGVRARAEARFTYGSTINFMVTNDSKWGTNLNLNIELRFAGNGMATRFGTDYSGYGRRYDQVRRNWPIQTKVDREGMFVPFINPRTGEAYDITWVDNTAAPGGTGNFEDPLTSLPSFRPDSDLILVRTGVGNTTGNITLVDYQQLLGEGQTHLIETTRGVIALPEDGFNRTGPAPILVGDGTATPVVTLANNNVVNSFQFNAENAISGAAVNNFSLRNLSGTVTNGIQISNASGVGFLENIDFALAPTGTGIHVESLAGSLALAGDNLSTSGGNVGIWLGANGGNITYDLDDVTVTDHATTGLRLRANGASLSGIATNVSASDNAGTGIEINGDNATGTMIFQNVDANNNLAGVFVGADNGSNMGVRFENLQANLNDVNGVLGVSDNGSILTLELDTGSISDNGEDNVQVVSFNGSRVNLFGSSLVMDNAGVHGLEFITTGDSAIMVDFDDVGITGSGASGINGVANDSNVMLVFNEVHVTGSGVDGMNLSLTNGSGLTSVITDSSFDDNTERNIAINAETGSVAQLDLTNVTADGGSTLGSVGLRSRTGGQISTLWNGGSISGSSGNGVTADTADVDSFVSMQFDGVTIDNNGGNGVEMIAAAGADGVGLTLENSSVSGNTVNGILATIDNSAGGILLTDTTIDGNTEDGIRADVTGGSLFTLGGTGTNSLSGNISNAIQLTNNASMAIVQLDGFAANNSGAEGITVATTNGGATYLDLSNGTINQSVLGGLVVTADGAGTIVDSMLEELTITQSGGSGIALTSSNGAQSGYEMTNVTSTFNTGYGLEYDALTGGALDILAVGTNFSNNTVGGVRGNADGAGSASSVSFENSIVNSNQGGGYAFTADNGAGMVVELLTTGSASSNLGGSGISMTANGAGTTAALIMDGDFDVNSNAGNGLIATATGVDVFAVQAMGNFNNNSVDGVHVSATDVATAAFSLSGVSASGNGDNNVQVQLTNTTTAPILVPTLTQSVLVSEFDISNLTTGGSGSDSIVVDLVDTTINNMTISNNTVTDSLASGITVNLNNSTVTALVMANNDIQNTTTNGIAFNVLNGSSLGAQLTNNSILDSDLEGLLVNVNGSTLTNFLLDGSLIQNSGNDGILVSLVDSNVVGILALNGGEVSGSGGHGVHVTANNSSIAGLDISGNNQGAGISGNTGDGIRLDAQNGSSIGQLQIDSNLIDNNGGHGVNLVVVDSTLPDTLAFSQISNNVITNHATGDGIRLVNPDTNGTAFRLDFIGNEISGNGGTGINVALRDAVLGENEAMTTVISDNTVSNNGGEGIALRLGDNLAPADGSYLNVLDFSRNTISDNGSFGLLLSAASQTSFDFAGAASSADADRNTISGNVDAGIAVLMNNTAGAPASSFNLSHTDISGTTDGSSANFNGEGLAVRLIGTSTLNGAVVGDAAGVNTTFNGNQSHGVSFYVNGSSTLSNLTVQNIESSDSIAGNGIQFERIGGGIVDNIVVTGSTFSNNVDGVNILARHISHVDDYLFDNNTITENRARGVTMMAQGDALLAVDLQFNDISDNASHGIQTNAVKNDASDLAAMTGNWLANTITNNGGQGIDLNSPYGVVPGYGALQIGDVGFGNTISGNELNGIRFGNTGGFANVVNNEISENGNSGIEINTAWAMHNVYIAQNDIVDNGNHGIDIINQTEVGVPDNVQRTMNVTIDNNLISRNGGDGIQILSSADNRSSNGNAGSAYSLVNVNIVNGNEVSFNGGRGIDTLVRGHARANIFIDDVDVFRNEEQGIYSVVTSDVNQSNSNSATAPLASNGGLFNNPILVFNLTNSVVSNNSSPGQYNGGGVVFRVGTSGAALTGNNTTNNTTWLNPGTDDPLVGGGLHLTMVDNEMYDNLGVDFWMHTFTSTRDPNTTGGAWSDQGDDPPNPANDVFNPQNYEQDPLARITVASFIGNVGGSADVFGRSAGGNINDPQSFAMYDNSEGVFKSRTDSQDPAGPFDIAGRNRNATRLAARTTVRPGGGGIVLGPPGNIPGTGGTNPALGSSQFLYSGVGGSTLRVGAGSDLSLSGFDTVNSSFLSTVNIFDDGLPNSADTAYFWQVFP